MKKEDKIHLTSTNSSQVQTLIERIETNALSDSDKQLLVRLLQLLLMLFRMVEDKTLSISRFKQTLLRLVSKDSLNRLPTINNTKTETYITKPKEVWEELEKNDKRLKLILELTNGAWWEWNCVTGETSYSPHFGYALGEQVENYKDLKNRVHPEDRDKTEKLLLRYVSEKKDVFHDLQHRVRTKEGEWRWVSANGMVVKRDENENPLLIIGVSLDITKYKQIEENLRRSEENLKQAQTVSHTGSWFLDIPNNKLEWSEETYRIFELPINTPLNLESFIECVHPEDQATVLADWTAALHGASYDKEHRIIAAGKIKWVRERAEVQFSKEGVPLIGIGTVQDITKQKQVATNLYEINKKLLIAMDMAKLGCWEFDVEKACFSFDENLFKLYGTTSEQEGSSFISLNNYAERFLPKEQVSLISQKVQEAITTTDPNFSQQAEHEIIRIDGSKAYITVRYAIVKDSKGATTKIYGVNQDITEQKLAEARIEQERRQSNAIIKSASDGIISVDENHNIVVFNPAAEKMFCCSFDEAIGQPIDMFIPINYRSKHKEYINQFGITGKSSRAMGQFGAVLGLRKTGEEFPMEASISHSELNGHKFFTLTCRDVTERKRAEEALRESEAHLRAIVESEPECVKTLDKRGRLISMNPAGLAMIEADSFEQIKGHNVLKLIAPEYHNAYRKQIARVFCGETIEQEFEIIGLKGTRRWLEQHAVPLWDLNNSNSVKQLLAVTRDITERKLAEEALRERESQLKEAQRIAHIGSWKIELSTKTSRWSDEMYKIFETTPQIFDHSEQAFFAMIHPEDQEMVGKIYYESLANKSLFQVVHRILLADQRIKFLEVQGFHYYDEMDQPLYSVGTVQDITERILVEQKIIASLREKEAMLKEIHHRVKNNLQIINSLLNLQSAQIKDPIVTAAFTEIKNRVRSMSLLHETLYKSDNFARIDLFSYVNSLCDYLSRSYGTNNTNIKILIDIAEIELNIEKAIPIGLIINELVSNALKYAFLDHNEGTISIKFMKSANRLFLTVSDNGRGLSKDFDFYNNGSLGLSLVSDLTSQLRGVIKLDNGKGTVFNLSFPY